VAKRGFDLGLSGVGLLFSAPLWLLISLAIFLEDRGSVFFLQDRVGLNGRTFRAFKFRSMRAGADKDVQAREHDPRVTGVGRLLRATAMDELPQLINIFLGDMSFVGPRALLASEVEVHASPQEDALVLNLFRKRCRVVPGLTGVAQIFAPRDIPRRKKFRYDLLYISKQTFLFDLKLIMMSFWITFRGRWEVRENKLNRDSKVR
jgi:lipopolysaccharide/colanic/teichoic acid biosynthesis glycosyltransferase